MLTQTDLDKIENIFNKNFDKKFSENFDKKIKPINKQLNKIQKDLKITINYFDHNFINHETRIKRAENHLNLPQT